MFRTVPDDLSRAEVAYSLRTNCADEFWTCGRLSLEKKLFWDALGLVFRTFNVFLHPKTIVLDFYSDGQTY